MVTHVDFLIVRRDEVISAEVPINLVGEAVEVHHGDGIVDQQLFSLPFKAKPADIPPSVDIDISRPDHRGSLHVSDITVPAGVELETDVEATVVAGQPPRVQATTGRGEGAAAAGCCRGRWRGATEAPATPSPRGLSPAPPPAPVGGPPDRDAGRLARGRAGQSRHRVRGNPAQRGCRGGRRPGRPPPGAAPKTEKGLHAIAGSSGSPGRRVLVAVPRPS